MTVTTHARPQPGPPIATAGTRHVTHRPSTPEELLLGTVIPGDCRFTLSDELPRAELPFEDGGRRPHDLHYVTAAMHSVARLAATRYLRIPARRPLRVARADVLLDDTVAWHRLAQSGHATTDLRLRHTVAADGGTGLDCEATVFMQGTRYATGSLSLELAAAPGSAAPVAVPDGPRSPVPAVARPLPEQVGRLDPGNVVLANPRFGPGAQLTADILPEPGNPVFDPAANERACALLLAEATRQAAVLAACELRGFTPAYCVTVQWSGQFPSDLDHGTPLSCRTVPGPVSRDSLGRPAVAFELTLLRGRTPTGTIGTTLVLDC
ncbi:hypothetical protein GCM10022403_067720 [Streptomyces coacervatus]|uniref:A-factor biosynthesis hotdog domain-containing protein n=1 Tax=Streptomyces coacervatus TaxID=647381 RepID=A0ABP7IRS7_9ACTN|nr:AfsA-related hotdog domain-containing protein [Streptomyces coacervatus]MDF2266804.1 AfsA-related hotdog domain-containing protein [Streptomyces coacervatus]